MVMQHIIIVTSTTLYCKVNLHNIVLFISMGRP